MDLELLISQIQSLDGALKQEASKAVNRLLTIRNWLIGYYIVEYEKKGEDRAKYGETLLQNIADTINQQGFSYRNLKLFRQFFLAYPLIGQTLSAQLQSVDYHIVVKSQAVSDEFKKNGIEIMQMPPAPSYEAQLSEKIINKLSFSHITLLLPISNPLKRTFYATEAIKGTWSVRELKRQVDSLLFERSGISKKPELLLQKLDEKTEKQLQTSFVKDIYTFEFLGLPAKDAVEEQDLESALLDHLQHFLIEMGHGFCPEARQKRILIGDEYFFIDLVFYHRILKCHVLIDLKVENFNHNNAGQLNTYMNYYKKEVQLPGDNAPVGISY